MTRHNVFKRTLAGILAVLTVAVYMPANVGGLLTESTAIVARAEEYYTLSISPYSGSAANDYGTIINANEIFTATPTVGYIFDHWEYNYGINSTSTNNPKDFSHYVLNGNVIAYFKKAVDLSNETVTATASTYTGSALTPEIKIGDKTLTAGTDYTYTVTNSNNQTFSSVANAGTYQVTVTAKNGSGYTGSKTVNWTVNRADSNISISEKNLTYTGAVYRVCCQWQ